MPRKMARSDPRPSVRVTRGAGSGQHLASVLQEGRENANIDAGLGFIWRISVEGPPAPWRKSRGHSQAFCGSDMNRSRSARIATATASEKRKLVSIRVATTHLQSQLSIPVIS